MGGHGSLVTGGSNYGAIGCRPVLAAHQPTRDAAPQRHSIEGVLCWHTCEPGYTDNETGS